MRLRDKAAKLSPHTKTAIKIAVCVISSICLVWGTFCAMSKQVSIVDDKGVEISFITYANNTADVLAEKEISLGVFDETSIPLNGEVKNGDTIYVYRAKPVTFINGRKPYMVITAKPTVEEFLKSKGVDTKSNIRTNAALSDKITANMFLEVTYLEEKTVNSEEVIGYNTKKVANPSMTSGETNIKQQGTDGIADRVYREYYENDALVDRELVKEDIKVAAVDEIIEYGTKSRQNISYSRAGVSRGGEYRYKQCLTVTATAYSGGGYTASGMKARYGAVAVDPRVIPLGSRLYIEAADGSWIYGTAVAADTGGAIKGNKIDLYVESSADAIRFGRRTAKVYILE
ncbi:MAG: G5 domain-containing protein [Clostridia bacterium]|nr:G5 domain-containing protein [Clostridia bacterium]